MKFVVLGDLHFTLYRSAEDSVARDYFFEVLFRKVAQQHADVVFAVGDIVHDGVEEEFAGLFGAARAHDLNLICTTGNHDTASLPKADLRSYFVGGKATGDELFYAFSHTGTRFVLLDTGREMLCDIDWSGYVSPEQQIWLRDEVRMFNAGARNDRNLVVIGHHPIFGTTDDSTTWRLNIDNSDEVRAALGNTSAGNAIYVCGHNHTNSLIQPDESGWAYVQCGAPLAAFSFRLITADADGLQVETVNFGLDDARLLDSVPALRAGLEHFADIPLSRAAGAPADREWQLKTSALRR
jgi:3',5'-cyclic-AMP phosphodiesterase